jgi:hypothetical protein
VKCLHAHIADHLVRGDNLIGEKALEKLTERGMVYIDTFFVYEQEYGIFSLCVVRGSNLIGKKA